MNRCILPVLVLLFASTSDDLLDLGLVNKADAQQGRRPSYRRPQARNNSRYRGRNNYNRYAQQQRYRSQQARQMQNIRNQINRQLQAQRAMMQRQQQLMAQIQRDAANGIYTLPNGQKAVQGFRDYEIVTAGEHKVRFLEPPTEFGTDGKKVKLSVEELKELKGEDTKTIGYEAKFEDLQVGQQVRIACASSKVDPKNKEKLIWAPAGEITGQISAIESQKIIVRVAGLVPQNVGKKIEKISVNDRQGKLIVITKQSAPGDKPFGGTGGFGADFGNFGNVKK